MAYLRKIKNSTGREYWQLRFRNRSKKPIDKSLYFPISRYRKADIKHIQAELEYKYKSGLWCPWTDKLIEQESRITPLFHDVLDLFKKDREKAYAGSTFEKIKFQVSNIKSLPETNVPIGTLDANTLSQYVNDESKSIETRKTRRSVIRMIEKWTMQTYPEKAGPFTPEVVAPQSVRRQSRKTYITSKELHGLVDIIPDHERTMADIITFAFYTGMRLSEITNMRVSWIQGDYIEIGDEAYRPKSDSSEATPVPITKEIQGILDRHSKGRKKTDYLFRTTGSRDNINKFISKRFKSYAKVALPDKQDKLSFHKLRDSSAMYWLHERNLDVYEVRTMLRHSSVTMTERYLHARPDALLQRVRK